MLIIIHRVNTIEQLKKLPNKYGVEIDVRGYGDKTLLNHDPIYDPTLHDDLEEYLKIFSEELVDCIDIGWDASSLRTI